jgi:hypothetical protein
VKRKRELSVGGCQGVKGKGSWLVGGGCQGVDRDRLR